MFYVIEIDGGKIKIQDKDGNFIESALDGGGKRRLLTNTIIDDTTPPVVGPLMAMWEEFTDAINLRPVATRGIGDFAPNTAALLFGADRSQAAPFHSDTSGNLVIRGDVMTDEQSFRDDFPGTALAVDLTGTVTVTNGDQTVTGTGTSFLSEVLTGDYIKIKTHTDAMWARVDSVISDEEIYLAVPYPGADGSAAAHLMKYIPVNLTNITVASSKATLASGTTASQETSLWRYVDYLPLMVHGFVGVSTRQANQEGRFGLSDTFSSPTTGALVIFDGTDSSSIKFRTYHGGVVEETTALLPKGYITSQELEYEISVLAQAAVLSIEGVVVARHTKHIPGPYDNMAVVLGWENGGSSPAGSANIVSDGIFISNHNRVEISQGFEGSYIPVQIREESHTIIAKRTTTATGAVEVIAYTVPTDKTFYLTGFSITSDDVGVDAHFKIGKGTIPLVDPTNPGTVDSGLIRAVFILARSFYHEQLSSPLYVAASGETVRVSVDPTSSTTTNWHVALDFVLR